MPSATQKEMQSYGTPYRKKSRVEINEPNFHWKIQRRNKIAQKKYDPWITEEFLYYEIQSILEWSY